MASALLALEWLRKTRDTAIPQSDRETRELTQCVKVFENEDRDHQHDASAAAWHETQGSAQDGCIARS
jgi:hypothetical protein